GTGGLRGATGADGAFAISGLRAGESYDLVVFGPGGIGARRQGGEAPAEGGDAGGAGPGRVAGRVPDAPTPAPTADFQVDFGPDRSSGGGGFGPGGRGGGGAMVARAIRVATGDGDGGPQPVHSEDGAYVLEDVPAGTWEVVAQARGYQTARV